MRTPLALVIACTLAVALPVVAHESDPTGPCTGIPAEPAIAVGPLYLSTAAPLVWSESNGVPGLQTHGHACTDENGRDRSIPADTHLV